MLFGAFDVLPGASRADLVALLKEWTELGALMAAGKEVGRNNVPPAPPDDTGEALGLPPSRLTMTFGFGPSLFTQDGVDRFGIAAKRPAALIELPPFVHDNLDPAVSGGDIAVQVCADDPQVTFHALRMLTRRGKGVVGLRWSQLGFGRTSSTSQSQETPRNLMGFKDGTNNVHGDDESTMDDEIWVGGADAPTWMHGGSYLVARRIRMRIENWDRDYLEDQERVLGRTKASGAPLGAKRELDKVDLHAKLRDGTPVIPRTRTSGSRHPRRTAARSCCVADTRSPMAWIRALRVLTPACSSSRTSATRASSSCRSSSGSRRRTL